MANNKMKALVIKVKSATEPQGIEFAWDKIPQLEVFTKSILIPEIAVDQQGNSSVNIGTIVSGMPTVFARAGLFDNALTNVQDKDVDVSGLLLFYKSLISEWKGFISCLALNYKDINIQRIHLAYSDGKQIADTENIYEPKGAFGNALFERKPLWCDQSAALNTEKTPFIDVISYKGQVVGGTSPDCFLFTSVSYRINERLPFLNISNGRFTDPLNSDLKPEELFKLYGYANHILKNIEPFRNQFNGLEVDIRPLYSHIYTTIQAWMDDMVAYQRARNFAKLEQQTPPEVGSLFQEPFARLFNYSTILYGSEGVISTDATSDSSISFDPKDLLLPDSTDIVQFDFGKAGISTKNYLRDKPILLLSAETKGLPNQYAYFALPLTPLALNVFGANLDALAGLSDAGNVRSRLSAIYDPNQQDNEKLTVQLKLITDSGSEIIKQVVYNVTRDTIMGRDILMWPNFISKQWGRYFLYSEIPHNDAKFQATPFIGNVNDDFFRIALDEHNQPLFLASKGSVAQLTHPDLKTTLHISSNNAVADNKYKYEIYESNQPFKGVKFAHAGQDCGFGMIRYTGTPESKTLPVNMLSSVRNLSPAYLGVDFGSTNTSIAYWSKDKGEVSGQLKLSNKRVSLLGSDHKNNDERPAGEDEIFFFQNDEILTNSIKSVLTLHDTRRVVNESGVQQDSLLSQPVKGGFPCFEKNLPISSAQHNRYFLNYNRVGSAELVYNMKWSTQALDKSYKTAYLGSLLLHVYAQLFIENHEPHTLKWSYPSSMGKDLLNEYRSIWDSLIEINPLNSTVRLKTFRPAGLSDIGKNEGSTWVSPDTATNGWGQAKQPDAGSSWGIGQASDAWSAPPAPQQSNGWDGPAAPKTDEIDIRADNGPISFDFEGLNDDESLSEACAVANYMVRPNDGYAVSQGELLLCFDIGGSTTDITVLSDLGRGKAMIKQNSIRFAAERLAQATKFSPNFKRVLLRMCERKHIYIQGLNRGDDKFSASTAPYYFEQVVDRLEAEDFAAFYLLIAADCKEMMSVNLYITGLIMFYAGQLVHKLRAEIIRSEDTSDLVKRTQPKIRIAFAGKGARIFDWFSAVDAKAANDYYTQMFLRGIGGEAVARQTINPVSLNPLQIIDINSKRGQNNADVKYEVSKGLAIPTTQTRILVPKNKDAIEILGEENFCLVRPGGQVEYLASTNSVLPEMIEHIGSHFLYLVEPGKAPCPRFMDFADLFYKVSSSMFGLKMTPADFMAGFQDMSIENYIKAVPEFQEAQLRKVNEQKKFDYVAPIIILEGMKFFEKHLLTGIQL